ncbi:Uncharacterised protein [Mycobacteroides abscessus]|nr:Uncharacterised protein [Mycobacteroides abscessus]
MDTRAAPGRVHVIQGPSLLKSDTVPSGFSAPTVRTGGSSRSSVTPSSGTGGSAFRLIRGANAAG